MLIVPALLTFLGIILKIIIRIDNKYFYWFTVLIAALASGFRSNVGRDYSVYEDFFTGQIPVSGVEPGFLLFSLIISSLSDTARLGFLICSIVTVFGFGYFFDRICKNSRLLCFHLYLTVPVFFVSSFNLLRINMAIALILVSLVLLIEKKRIRTFLTVIFATMLHYSVPVMLGPMLLVNKYLKWFTPVLFLFFLALAVFILGYEASLVSGTKYSYYLNHDSDNNPIMLGSFAVIALVLFFITYSSSDVLLRAWISKGNFLTFFFIMLWLFSGLGNIWLRVAQLFFVSVIVSIAFSLERIKQKLLKDVVTFNLVLLLFIYFMIKYLLDPSFGYVL